MSNEFKVVSGSTNVLLIINGKGVPAQVTKPSDKDANEHWRFLVRDDRLSEFFPYVAQLESLIHDLYECTKYECNKMCPHRKTDTKQFCEFGPAGWIYDRVDAIRFSEERKAER